MSIKYSLLFTKGRLLFAAASLLLLPLATVAGPASVHAQAGITTCAGISTTNYSPGLTFTPQVVNVSFTSTLEPCTSTSEPNIVSAVAPQAGYVGERSCSQIPSQPAEVTQTITWNTGQISILQYTPIITTIGGVTQVTGTGTVIGGLFEGATMTKTMVLSNLDPQQLLACLTTGLTSVTGPYNLTITEL